MDEWDMQKGRTRMVGDWDTEKGRNRNSEHTRQRGEKECKQWAWEAKEEGIETVSVQDGEERRNANSECMGVCRREGT